jgi:neutral ceramidase
LLLALVVVVVDLMCILMFDRNELNNFAQTHPVLSPLSNNPTQDVSPNTDGAKCIDTGLPCDAVTSTCNGRNEKCIAFGPGTNGDMYESVEIIGRKQFEHARSLMNATQPFANGPISYVHRFADMSKQNVTLSDGSIATTCTPAMGYAFAAGTTDGPGAFNFHQASNETTPFWNFVSDLLSTPTPEQIACQAPKPILLNLDIKIPYQWDAEVVPVQLFRINTLFIAVVPSEFTTMAGRRLRNMIASRVVSSGIISEEDADEVVVVIGGLANSYADYVTTYEEYQAQRYEAASTIFGPYTHQAYMQLFESLVDEMAGLIPKPDAPTPPNNYDEMLQAIPNEVKYDDLPSGSAFGMIIEDVNTTVGAYVAGGGQVVGATFQGANPRADLKHGGTYLTVERYDSDKDSWTVVATDADLYTKFIFTRASKIDRHESHARVEWVPQSSTKAGTYRLHYYGDATSKNSGTSTPFEGISSTFEVAASA